MFREDGHGWQVGVSERPDAIDHGMQEEKRKLAMSASEFRKCYGMPKALFFQLRDWLGTTTEFPEHTSRQPQDDDCSNNVKLLIFLEVVTGGIDPRQVSAAWGLSGETTYQYFSEVLNALGVLAEKTVKMPTGPDDYPANTRLSSRSYGHFFKDCIGAVDDCYFDANVPEDVKARCPERRELAGTNVVCIVDFDGRILWIRADLDGGKKDDAEEVHIPEGKFVLGDSDFEDLSGIQDQIMGPFPATRTNPDEFGPDNPLPQSPEELFNIRHRSLHSTVGLVLQHMRSTHRVYQVAPHLDHDVYCRVVTTTAALHNFLLEKGAISLGAEGLTDEG